MYYRGAFFWGVGTELLILYLPDSIAAPYNVEVDPSELTQYAAIRTIDLFDDDAVDEFLIELRAEIEFECDSELESTTD